VPLEPLAAELAAPSRASGSELLARIEALEARVASLESQLGLA
jgi:BMFP domain-containing protein YqiC